MPVCNIFQLQRFSVNDGEGIRTTIFFKGCHLRCQWCANPESWSFERQLLFFADKCVQCGRCVAACSNGANEIKKGTLVFARSKCTNKGTCSDICPTGARKFIGEALTIDEVVERVKKDYIYFTESNGGVTFSGGEPFLHTEYLRELNLRCQGLGINTAVESCGYFDFAANLDILERLDMIFFDLKTMDSDQHKRFTGVSNEIILQNIRQASALNRNIVVRIPVITGINDDAENIKKTAQFLLNDTTIRRVELLKYHQLGMPKMQALGVTPHEFVAPTEIHLDKLKKILGEEGMKVVSYA